MLAVPSRVEAQSTVLNAWAPPHQARCMVLSLAHKNTIPPCPYSYISSLVVSTTTTHTHCPYLYWACLVLFIWYTSLLNRITSCLLIIYYLFSYTLVCGHS